MADKVTVNGKTMDITAVTTVVPEAPPGKMLQTFVIGAPVEANCSGSEHARRLQTTVRILGTTHIEQLAVIAADGQVHHNRASRVGLRVNPISARVKPNGKARVILDLSALHGDAVNEMINPDECTVRYASRDDLAQLIFAYGGAGTRVFKADVRAAFQTHTRPA